MRKLAIIMTVIVVIISVGVIFTVSSNIQAQNNMHASSQTKLKEINVSLSENVGASENKP